MTQTYNEPQEVLNYHNLMIEHRPCVWCDVPVYYFAFVHGYTELNKVYCCKCGRRVD